MISVTEFRTRFFEFSDEEEYSTPYIEMMIGDSTLEMGVREARWGVKYDIAQAYLTAHLLAIADKTSAGDKSATVGPIASKTAGSVSVTRSVVAVDRSEGDLFYSSTQYGIRFIAFRNACFVGVCVT